MSTTAMVEAEAEQFANLLDHAVHIPRTRIRFGLDPLIGLIPIVGDLLATACGAMIVVMARRCGLSARTLCIMAWNLTVNGVIGSIPVVGDAFSFSFKCHAKNTAVLLREVKHGERGACDLRPLPVRCTDIAFTIVLMAPVLTAVGVVSIWLWEHDISLVSMLFPAPYSSRTPQ